ncbi:MAG: OmpA family protein [Phaeodactylibacter sp.]|nr:OmpA family protein [Phaeodactylibacter sp.]MCB9297257.1 OmpA family protein [Lewinellaceae bacterium]
MNLAHLTKLATSMGAVLHLSGHTDGSGLESGNQELSLHRARSLKQFLVMKCGFNPDKIYVYGYCVSRPICPNDTEEGQRGIREAALKWHFVAPLTNQKVVSS